MATSQRHPAPGGNPPASPDPAPTPPPGQRRPGSVVITVVDRADGERSPLPVPYATVSVYHEPTGAATGRKGAAAQTYEPDAYDHVTTVTTGPDGVVRIDNLERRGYIAYVNHYPRPFKAFDIVEGCIADVEIPLGVGFTIGSRVLTNECQPIPCAQPRVNDIIEWRANGTG